MPDDAIFNIKFVEIVEKYPCIYDFTRLDHSKREAVEKAWTLIGAELKMSAAQCKEKWKNLRTALARRMKKPPSGSGSTKVNYYLKDVMQFVLPFMKPKRQYSNLETTEETGEQDDKSTEKNTAEPQLNLTILGEDLIQQEVSLPMPIENEHFNKKELFEPSKVKKRPINKSTENEADKCFIDYINLKKAKVENAGLQDSDPDMEFLKSLIPDIKKMKDFQKRQFKIRTLGVIDSILCDTPSQNFSYSLHPSPRTISLNEESGGSYLSHSVLDTSSFQSGMSREELEKSNSTPLGLDYSL